ISTANTTGGSALTILAKGGNGAVTVGGITVNGSLKSITGKNTTVVGDLEALGSLGKVLLASISNGAISVGGANLSLQLTGANNVSLTSAGTIKSIQAGSWNSTGVISAPSIANIKITHDATMTISAGAVRTMTVGGTLGNSTLTLTAPGVKDLTSFKAGALSNTQINATGNLGSLSANSMVNSQIYAGIVSLPIGQELPTAAGAFSAQDIITSVKIGKGKGAATYVNSAIAAAQIRSATLGKVQFANGGAPFGIAAHNIASLTATDASTGKTFTLKKLSTEAAVMAQLAAKGITPQDFTIKIV
ncbi:MAG: hypothetical protein JWL69_3823, partial [Phycisphaerales bacterium]|nr:hypothetical protein [Phycisphaerales bacterium]